MTKSSRARYGHARAAERGARAGTYLTAAHQRQHELDSQRLTRKPMGKALDCSERDELVAGATQPHARAAKRGARASTSRPRITRGPELDV